MRKAKSGGRRQARSKSWPAPIGGWIRNQNVGRPDPTRPQGAEILRNIFPTATGAQLRGGSLKYGTLGDGDTDVTAFLRYKSGSVEKLFAAIETAIYEISTIVDPDASPVPAVAGLTSGAWISTQFEATGGIFLIGVNGEDEMRLFDGDWWYPLGAANLFRLVYDAKTTDFSAGETVTGGTSGATAVIVAVQPASTNTGALILKSISGTFQDNEALTDGDGGAATANGTVLQIFNAISGIATEDLSYIWAYKNRLFGIEKGTLNAWYAAIDQVGGTLTKFPMAGIFAEGGSLLFGCAWSLVSGDGGGLSNQCVFVTTEGEVAVYQGADPGNASDWALVGVYRIGIPLGPLAWFRAGSDVVIETSIGVIPLSQAVSRDVAGLAPAAVSYPIETEWNDAVAQTAGAPWSCIIWPERQMFLTALPTPSGTMPRMFAANARTGSWCEFSNWNGKCLVVFQGRLFFGSTNGKVIEAYVTGLDQGEPYTGIYVPLFDDLRMPDRAKTPHQARAVVRGLVACTVQVSGQYDYEVSLPSAPSAAPITSGSLWGLGIWGEAVWGGSGQKVVQDDWMSLAGEGHAVAVAVQIASGSVAQLDTEIIRIDMTYEVGDL